MATIRAYTSVEQSKKLAEILPLKSADMYWIHVDDGGDRDFWKVETIQLSWRPYKGIKDNYIPAWSLAALLSVLPSRLFDSTPKRKELYLLPDLDKSYCFYRQFAVKTKGEIYLLTEGECLVDACVAMIKKLHKIKKL